MRSRNPRHALLCVAFAAAGASAQNTLKMPVQVDQSGKTLYLVTTESSDVLLEALRFCAAHLPSLELDECARNLAAEEAAMRAKSAVDRDTAQSSLPGLSFTVQSPEGELLRFTHEEGANPADEARPFPAQYHADLLMTVQTCVSPCMSYMHSRRVSSALNTSAMCLRARAWST